VTAPPTADEVGERLASVREEIASLGVDPDAVTIVAVTKARDADVVAAALDAGLVDIGENYAQELVAKVDSPELAGRQAVRWHAIGRLQRNKVRLLAPHIELWQAVDRPALGTEIARRAPGARVLVQVNLSGEAQKGGCEPAAAASLVEHLQGLGLSVEGLMGVATAGGGRRAAGEFAQLRAAVDALDLPICSMGMSGDFREAVVEGATMLRLGTALVGERPAS
jgi:pyridoxal phosphate enzyme (YggS family)